MTKIGEHMSSDGQIIFYQAEYTMTPGKVAVVAHLVDPATGFEEPFCTVSVNTDHVMPLGHFVVSHNMDLVMGLEAEFLATGLFEDTGVRVDYGMVRNRPVWKLK